MPAAANTAIFSELFTGEASFASRCVVITTLLSILTLPALITLASL
jgi:predicted permease